MVALHVLSHLLNVFADSQYYIFDSGSNFLFLIHHFHVVFRMFDDVRRKEARHDFVYSFRDHTLRVTNVKSGHGGSNAVIISASEDQTCKVR